MVSVEKHGRDSGLSCRGGSVPELPVNLGCDIRVLPAVTGGSFIEANPALTRDAITMACAGGDLQDCAPDMWRNSA